MRWSSRGPRWLAAAVACLLLCSSCCEAGRLKFDFKMPGSAKAELGVSRLARIQKRSDQTHKSIDEIANEIERDPDLGVDLDHDMLIYSCEGLAVTPEVEAVAAQATGAAELFTPPAEGLVVAEPLVDPSIIPAASTAAEPAGAADPAPAAQDSTPGHHHHHHHHHRHLLQVGVEWGSPWPFLPEIGDTAITPTLTKAQTFKLHSRPGATRKIFLDFDGHTTVNAAWNHYNGSKIGIITPPFDTDNNPSSFSANELAQMLAIFRGVAEDYALFDVDVTTEEPTAAPVNTWTRVAIGGSCFDWYINGSATTSGAGGVAYVGVFGRSDTTYQPAFVFINNLAKNPKYIWEAVSHESGHNMGLSHDGTTSGQGYYSGHAGWAPIMGVSYYQSLTQWSKGEYPLANNKEDDIDIIARKLTYIYQQHGATAATATVLAGTLNAAGTNATANITAILSKPDGDDFAFYSGPGTARVQVLQMPAYGSAARSNLNLTMNITDANGVLVDSRSGVGIPSRTVTIPSAGWYYISLTPTGMGNPTTNTGYSNYGSRGQAELLLTYPYAAANASITSTPRSKYLAVQSITGTKAKNTTSTYVCTFLVTVSDPDTFVLMPNVNVTGRFTTTKGYNGWPTSTSVLTNANGVATLKSPAVVTTAGYDCNIAITDLTRVADGYVMQPNQAATALTFRLFW